MLCKVCRALRSAAPDTRDWRRPPGGSFPPSRQRRCCPAAEEARGLVRWLRSDYHNPAGRAVTAKAEQAAFDIGPTESTAKTPWPKDMPAQIAAVRAALQDLGEATPDQIARRFHRVQSRSVQPLLEILTALGQARLTDAGNFAN